MEELQLISRQHPGEVVIDNFVEMKEALSGVLSRYKNVAYTETMLPDAKADKKELSRLRREIDSRRKEIKRAYLAPYNEFEAQVKELLAMVDAPLEEIKRFVSEMEGQEKEAKRAEIRAYFTRQAAVLGELAQTVFDSPAFFDPRWLNKTTRPKTWQAEVDEKIAQVAQDLRSIRATGGAQTGALVTRYLEDLDRTEVEDYHMRVQAVEQAAGGPTPAGEPRGYKILKLTGTAEQMAKALELLAQAGVNWEELESGTL